MDTRKEAKFFLNENVEDRLEKTLDPFGKWKFS